jgi:Tfp pilus assembly protein PilO
VKKRIPITLVVLVLVVAAAVAGYLLVLRPKTNEIEKLDAEVAALETELRAAEELAQPGEEPELPIKTADVVELAKAMPDDTAMAEAILELNAAAEGAGVEFIAITPGTPIPGAGYTQLPLQLSFEGSYYNLTELVFRVRSLVSVRDGVLHAFGRYLSLDSINWHESEAGFPTVQADITVSAYVYGNSGVPAATPGAVPPPAATETTTTGTTDTTATTTGPAGETQPPATGEQTSPTATEPASDSSQQADGVTP